MTILVWCSWIAESGGMERVAVSLANGLSNRGHRVVLVGPYSNAPNLRYAIAAGVRYINYLPRRSVKGLLDTRAFLKNLVQELRVDLISAHGSVFPLLGLPVPVVWTEHGLRYGNHPMLSGVRGLAWRLVRRELQQGRWHLVTVSRFVMQRVREELSLSKTIGSVIYNGIPGAQSLRILAAPKLQPPYQLGYLGRLEPEKRPTEVFDLAALLHGMGVPCHWHIFGKGSLLDEMEARRRLCPCKVEMHGNVPRLREVFEAIDLLFVPSRAEGLPTVVLEARLAGRWVAGWHSTGIPEAAGPDGILVEPSGGLLAMAEAISVVLRSGKRPPPIPEGQFDFEQMVQSYDELLQQRAA